MQACERRAARPLIESAATPCKPRGAFHECRHRPARDDIRDTLDYDFVREVIAQAVGQQHHELQETLCDAVLAAVLRRPEVQAARVATRKPDVYADSASVGVERVAVKPW